MAKQKSKPNLGFIPLRDKPEVKAPVETIKVADRGANGGFVSEKTISRPFFKTNIIDTPPPYTQAWLDAHGLEVVYKHGRAVLQFKK